MYLKDSKMKRTAYTILFLCFIYSIQAQEKKPIQIKWNASTLMNYMPSIQGGIQYHFKDKIHLQHEIGIISGYFSPFWKPEDELIGLRVNNTIKYYFDSFSKQVPIYCGFDIFYRTCSYQTNWSYSMYDGAYFQIIPRERKKQVIAGSFLLGFEPFVSDKAFLEFFGGLGVRHLTITDEKLPQHAEMWRMGSLFRHSEGTFYYPNITLGMRIGFIHQ